MTPVHFRKLPFVQDYFFLFSPGFKTTRLHWTYFSRGAKAKRKEAPFGSFHGIAGGPLATWRPPHPKPGLQATAATFAHRGAHYHEAGAGGQTKVVPPRVVLFCVLFIFFFVAACCSIMCKLGFCSACIARLLGVFCVMPLLVQRCVNSWLISLPSLHFT